MPPPDPYFIVAFAAQPTGQPKVILPQHPEWGRRERNANLAKEDGGCSKQMVSRDASGILDLFGKVAKMLPRPPTERPTEMRLLVTPRSAVDQTASCLIGPI